MQRGTIESAYVGKKRIRGKTVRGREREMFQSSYLRGVNWEGEKDERGENKWGTKVGNKDREEEETRDTS